MDLEDLKSGWNKSGHKSLNQEDIKQMVKINQHPVLRKIRLKLILESLFLTILLFLYYDGFDGDKKPLYVNALLVLSIVIYNFNNTLGYFNLRNPIKAENIVQSITKQISLLKKMSVLSGCSSIFYTGSLLFFFVSTVQFSSLKYIMIAIMMVFYFIMFYFSMKNWNSKIQHFQKLLDEFK